MYFYAYVMPMVFKCLQVCYKFLVGHNPNVSIVQIIQLVDAFGFFFFV